MKTILLLTLLSLSALVHAQNLFQPAYAANPYIPEGLLEAVAWTNTRMEHLSGQAASCTGMPQAYGIMGLHDNGQGYFRENGVTVAIMSGISVAEQKQSAAQQIMAYATTFNTLMAYEVGIPQNRHDAAAIRLVLRALSEIPDSGLVNQLALDLQAYGILEFMNDPEKAASYGFPAAGFDLPALFGTANYKVLSGRKINFTSQGITSDKGEIYAAPQLTKSIEYGPATWNPADSCNFSFRDVTDVVSAITIHTVQGTYSGCISWFQNCSASVSAHYVIRSSDGQVTQMVSEADKAWHVGTENSYTIGYEHEGYVSNPSWYTEAMYVSSADLSRDIVNSGYGINPLRTFDGPASSGTNVLGGCIKIKGHQHFPNQTHVDPGINWDWEHYYQLINDPPSVITITSTSGTLYDTGGAAGNYPDDQRQLWLIQPPTAQTITLEFTAFDLETNWDYLYIYDGDSLDDPLIGIYTGTSSPGVIISSGNSLLLEFRSDCNTTAPGWVVNFTETTPDDTPPVTTITQNGLWYTDDFTVDYTDIDAQSAISDRFYLAARKSIADNDWSSDGAYGFAFESFEDGDANWYPVTGTYSVSNGEYLFSDDTEQNSNTYMAVEQTASFLYLYEWNQTITSTSSNQRAGIHFFCDNPNLPNRGNSYFIYLRENDNKLQIYSVDNDVFTLQEDVPFTVNQGQTYNVKTIYNPTDGLIRVYIDGVLSASWEDLTPLTSGSFISLRTGGCAARFDNVRVYTSRGTQTTLPAGFTDLLNIESESAIPSGMVRSLALDAAGNWSLPTMETFLLDFTPPTIDYLYDGPSNDIDTFTTSTLEANWNAVDIHSDIASYDVAIGSLPNLDDVYPWTNQASAVLSTVLSNPVYDQVYYLSVRAINNAGLSNQFMSDGQRYINDLGLDHSGELIGIEIYPNPATSVLSLKGNVNGLEFFLYDAQGKLCLSQSLQVQTSIEIGHLSEGIYNAVIRSGQQFVVKKVVIKH